VFSKEFVLAVAHEEFLWGGQQEEARRL